MDVDKLAIDLLLKGMTKEQQNAALDSIKESVTQAKAIQKQRIGENVQVVVQALKKMEADIKARYDETGRAIEKRVASIKDGKDGQNGVNGKDGRDGRPGRDGSTGPKGNDGLPGRNGIDGVDGVSVTNAFIDFDGSLIINLSNGQDLNVGEVVAPDLAEKIKVITNGGGTSQQVLDTLASLQTQINNLIPSQTGNAGKFLTTDGTDLSWGNAVGGLSYEGTWDASTNTPTLASGVGINGYYYITATAGSTNLDGITDWEIGDWLLFNGTVWQKIDQSNLVTSVNGQTGAVTVGTVTSVGGTGTVSGISLSGTVTSSGDLTLGGALDLSSPPVIGGTAPNSATFTTVNATTFDTNVAAAGLTLSGTSLAADGTDANINMLITPKGSGGVGINGSPTGDIAGSTLTAKFCVKQDESGPVAAFVKANNSAATPGSTIFACRSRGTLLSPTAVQDDDRLVSILALGFDGADLASSSEINFEVDGTPGANDMPGRIVFKTSADGSQTPTEAMRIDSTQTVTIPKASMTNATVSADLNLTGTLSVNGSSGTSGYVLTSNGASDPTWEPNANGVAIVDDTTTNATRYLTFTDATTGNITTENVSSTKLQFNPSTGTLSSTVFATNTVNEETSGSGVTIDSVLLKDNKVTTSELTVNGNNISATNSLGFRNRIINGDMRIDQRNAGASVTLNGNLYSVDRWGTQASLNSKATIQQSATAPTGFTNSVVVTSSSAYSPLAADFFWLYQTIEGFNIADLNWGSASAQAVTLSFWVSSSLTGTFSVRLGSGSRSYVTTYTIASANTYEYKTVTIPGDTSGTWNATNGTGVQVQFDLGSGSNRTTATTNAWQAGDFQKATGTVSLVSTNGATLNITGVQLEAGSVATPFERRPYGTELALCQRYFQKSYNTTVAPGTNTTTGSKTSRIYNTDAFLPQMETRLLVSLRASPTVTWYTTGGTAGSINIGVGTNTINTQYAVGMNSSGWVFVNGSVSSGDQITGHFTASAEL
jgi:hypothetical protein